MKVAAKCRLVCGTVRKEPSVKENKNLLPLFAARCIGLMFLQALFAGQNTNLLGTNSAAMNVKSGDGVNGWDGPTSDSLYQSHSTKSATGSHDRCLFEKGIP